MAGRLDYMLRKTLIPWKVEQTIDEVLEYCKVNHVGEVIWKIDVEEFNKGFTSLDTVRQAIPWLKQAKKKYDAAGIITSINPWMTLNHSSYGRDSRKDFPDMQWMVDADGSESKACACPLSPVLQEHLVQVYRLYAEVKPNNLWIEDDFRHFNHRPAVKWGCFCPVHLEKFSAVLGREITREELVRCILKPGKPHPYRAKWMDFLGENMVELAEKLERAVHAVSPETKLALMLSGAEEHSIEGRKWHQLLRSFAGAHTPVSRPPLPPYVSERFDEVYLAANVVRKVISCTPEGTIHCPEIDIGGVFGEFVKPAKLLRAQLLISTALGNSAITMNLYDHVGTALPLDDAFALTIRENKPFFDGLLEYCKSDGVEKGIGQLFHPDIAKYVRTTSGEEFPELYPKADGWAIPLQGLGHSITYSDPEPGVIAITGQITRAYTDEQLKQILSKGVLLDASAAQVLSEQGYGKYIGVDILGPVSKTDIPVAAEEIAPDDYISPRQCSRARMLCRFKPFAEAKVISTIVDFNKNPLMPGMVLFENSLGGRVGCFAIDLQDGIAPRFLSWKRKKQLKEVIQWLSKDKLELFVSGGAHSLPIRIDYADYSVISVINNSPDTWPKITVEFGTNGREVKQILTIDKFGRWIQADCVEEKCENDLLTFTVDKKLEFMELAGFCVKFGD